MVSLERRLARAERGTLGGPDGCARCGGVHLRTFAAAALAWRLEQSGATVPPACSCTTGCCPDWAALAEEARHVI
jgi:hypothetical protein